METCKGFSRTLGHRPQHSKMSSILCKLQIGTQSDGMHSRKPIRWQPCAVRHLSSYSQRFKRSLCGSRHSLNCRSEQASTNAASGKSNVTIDIGQEPVSTHVMCPCQRSAIQHRGMKRLTERLFHLHNMWCDTLLLAASDFAGDR